MSNNNLILSPHKQFNRLLYKPNLQMMKKFLFLFTCQVFLLVSMLAVAQDELSKADRDKAIEHLKGSQAELLKTVKGLSDEQLNFTPNDSSWSIAGCVEHLAISETALFGIVEQTLTTEADPLKRSEVKFTDEQILGLITDRTSKIKTRPEFEPKNNFESYQGSVEEFKSKRKQNIKFVKTTTDNMRNKYFEFPFGIVDCYQVVLFMSGHSERHTAQIKEVMAHASFPKSK